MKYVMNIWYCRERLRVRGTVVRGWSGVYIDGEVGRPQHLRVFRGGPHQGRAPALPQGGRTQLSEGDATPERWHEG